jgi:hypothetical protein
LAASRAWKNHAGCGVLWSLIVNHHSAIGSSAIWQQNGIVYGVAGTLEADEISGIATGLRSPPTGRRSHCPHALECDIFGWRTRLGRSYTPPMTLSHTPRPGGAPAEKRELRQARS